MHTSRVIIDGLWRCLCPSFEKVVIKHTIRPTVYDANRNGAYINKTLRRQRIRPLSLSSTQLSLPRRLKNAQDNRIAAARDESVETISDFFDKLSLTELHEHLEYLKAKPAKSHDFSFLIEYLISIRGENPTVWHYDALIYANADPRHGSAATVKILLAEMEEEGIAADSRLYHTVLQVLAIHPDYALRAHIMQQVKEKWIGLSPEGWHNLALGFLRDRQLEVAMDQLQQMHTDNIKVQQWLYDIYLYQLCEADELDEAFKLLEHINVVKQRTITFTPHMWYHLLDAFSRAFHHEGTKYIWYGQVPQMLLKPTDGICVSVLNTAARCGDQTLAIDCLRVLSSRSILLTTYHYEALLSAHANGGDIYNSFRILSVMSKAGIEPDASTTRPLYEYFTCGVERPSSAWAILRQLHKDNHTIHVSAINVVIESHYFFKHYFEMLQLYKQIHNLTSEKPNLETFNILLRAARQLPEGVKAHTMFLASEMRHFDVKPDDITYDRLVLACLIGGDLEDAYRYFAEMKEEGEQFGWWLRDSTIALLAKTSALKSDGRAWDLFDEHVKRTRRTHRGLKAEIEKAWKGDLPEGRLEKWKPMQPQEVEGLSGWSAA